MTPNQVAWQVMLETVRSNKAREQETFRHNVVTEGEAYRHNTTTETEFRRHNEADEWLHGLSIKEQTRHNIASEGISRAQVRLGYDQLSELRRHNKAQEVRDALNLAEAQRSNLARERISSRTNQLRASELLKLDRREAYRLSIARKKLDLEEKELDLKGVNTAAGVMGNLLGSVIKLAGIL